MSLLWFIEGYLTVIDGLGVAVVAQRICVDCWRTYCI